MSVRPLAVLRNLSFALPLVGLAFVAARPAHATLQFQQVFLDRYLAEHPDRDYVQFVRTQAKCFTCHQGCKDRHNQNAFGRELAKRLDPLADRTNIDKILAALAEVAKLPADPTKMDGPTFGERIQAGQLPAGELEDAKREPATADAPKDDCSN